MVKIDILPWILGYISLLEWSNRHLYLLDHLMHVIADHGFSAEIDIFNLGFFVKLLVLELVVQALISAKIT